MLERANSKAGWARVAFGDVVRLSRARVPSPEAAGIERVVGLEHIEPSDLRVRRWGDVADGTTFTTLFKPGQVLFGKRRAYQRKVAVADFEGVCSGDIYVLEPANDRLMSELLPFLCQTDAFFDHAVGTSAGSLSPRTNWTSLASFEFLLPPVQEQERLLEPLVRVRALEEDLLSALDRGEKTYEAWVENEFKGHGWPVRSAIDLLTRATVGIVVKPADWYVSSGRGVRALRSLNVLKNRLSWEDCVEISDEGHSLHQKSALCPGDVVIVRSGRPGDAAVIPPLGQPLNAIDLIISTTGPALRPEYFCRFINSVAGRRQFASGIAGTAQLHFNVELFKKLRIPVPPLAEQDAFVARAHQFDGTLNDLRKRLGVAQELKKLILKEFVCA